MLAANVDERVVGTVSVLDLGYGRGATISSDVSCLCLEVLRDCLRCSMKEIVSGGRKTYAWNLLAGL